MHVVGQVLLFIGSLLAAVLLMWCLFVAFPNFLDELSRRKEQREVKAMFELVTKAGWSVSFVDDIGRSFLTKPGSDVAYYLGTSCAYWSRYSKQFGVFSRIISGGRIKTLRVDLELMLDEEGQQKQFMELFL